MISAALRLLDHLRPPLTVHAHCDLPCGVYDPIEARLQAEGVLACMEKGSATDDPDFRTRALIVKEDLADKTKHHLWVLWTDYFKPEHLEAFPDLHDKFWRATKLAGEAKKTMDVATGNELLAAIDDIAEMFWATKGGKPG